MRLIRFLHNNSESYGVQIDDDQILALPSLARTSKSSLMASLDQFILNWKSQSQVLQNLIQDTTEKEKRHVTKRLTDIRPLAPIFSPPKIVCLGLNYRDHAAESNAPLPAEPIIFMKPRTAIIGPGQPVVKPAFVKELDYEAELAVIIGQKGKDIAVENAEEYVFGYTCFNDVSARDIQFKDKQWTRGKSLDTFAPIGPCITTADQIGDPTNLWIRTRVNGEIRQDSSTRNMVFNVFQIIHELSRIMTLEPCDIIATGTPAGVAFAMKPNPKFLELGDVVEIEIENIGILRNQVVSKEAT